MKGYHKSDPSMYLVCEKRLTCIDIQEHVAISSDHITGPESAKRLLTSFFEDEPYETVFIVALDSSNRFLGFIRLAEGTANAATVHLRKILTFLLIETNATGMIIAHNHPGGSGQPSAEDIALTRRLRQRLRDVDVRLLDHLIFIPAGFGNPPRWVSMSEDGHMPNPA